MLSSGRPPLVLLFAAILGFLVLSAYGDSGGPQAQDRGYPVVTFYVA